MSKQIIHAPVLNACNMSGDHSTGISFQCKGHKDFVADTTVINGHARAAYSKTGIYVGCEGFDCDPIAWLHFYRRKDGTHSKMEEIAVYKNNKWRLAYIWDEDYPELNGLDQRNAFVRYKDALYCMGIENYYDENGEWCYRPIFLKLELVPSDKTGAAA